ncbi:spermidine synthase [Paenibacillus glacialis]|uniref:Spermidine synthase n=1 Tax=Paenibacillus glacialis TaxID=494026 RepID=A0A162K6Y9_9BACL|nr:fused MFS/spermidine synthase [Paenibacillus glacialis]OAB41618.1 spermidine synthase [Paenibacillus glacialis]
MHLLFKELSDNHEITVYDTNEWYGEKGNFRVLQFSNDATQGAMDLNDSERVMFEYPRAIIHLMEFNDPSFNEVFLIGHGIGTMASYFSEKNFKVAELDEKVVELSKTYFGYSKDNVIIGDGRSILESEETDVYDYIILDAFTDKGTPRQLVSKDFFQITGDKLRSDGSVILNLMGRVDNDTLINAIHSTLRESYNYSKVFSLPSEGVTDIQNIIIMGSYKPINYQARNMAGFNEMTLEEGYIIWDK